MARYQALASFIRSDGVRIAAGAEFEFSGIPAVSFKPLDAAAIAAKVASIRDEVFAERSIRSFSPSTHFKLQNHRTAMALARSLGWDGAGTVETARAYIDQWSADNA